MYVCVCARARMRGWVGAFVRACMHACVCVMLWSYLNQNSKFASNNKRYIDL